MYIWNVEKNNIGIIVRIFRFGSEKSILNKFKLLKYGVKYILISDDIQEYICVWAQTKKRILIHS